MWFFLSTLMFSQIRCRSITMQMRYTWSCNGKREQNLHMTIFLTIIWRKTCGCDRLESLSSLEETHEVHVQEPVLHQNHHVTHRVHPACKRTPTLSIMRRMSLKKPVVGIRIRMFLGLPDPDPLIRAEVCIRILPFSHKDGEQTEIMLACETKILAQNFSKKSNFKDAEQTEIMLAN